jgi:hypothetical protein
MPVTPTLAKAKGKWFRRPVGGKGDSNPDARQPVYVKCLCGACEVFMFFMYYGLLGRRVLLLAYL